MATSNWRDELLPATRKLNLIKIRDKLKSYHYIGDEDVLLELDKIAQNIEEKTYAGATSESDYLEKIALAMQLMVSKLQEEVYQKIKTMKENYLPELNEMYQKIVNRLQQLESLPQHPKSYQLEKLKVFKMMLERIIAFLQVSKSNISHHFKEKLGPYERQIINFINTNRPRKAMASMQPGKLPSPSMLSMSPSQSQVTQVQSHENRMNSPLQTTNSQGSVTTMQQIIITRMQHNSIAGVSTAQQKMMNSREPADTNLRKQSNRSKRRPTWTQDYHMG